MSELTSLDDVFKEYLEALGEDDDFYTFTFKTYHPLNMSEDIKNDVPIRVRVSIQGFLDVDKIDQYFIYDTHYFFEKNYGEMTVEKGEEVNSFNNLKEMQKRMFGGRPYVLV